VEIIKYEPTSKPAFSPDYDINCAYDILLEAVVDLFRDVRRSVGVKARWFRTNSFRRFARKRLGDLARKYAEELYSKNYYMFVGELGKKYLVTNVRYRTLFKPNIIYDDYLHVIDTSNLKSRYIYTSSVCYTTPHNTFLYYHWDEVAKVVKDFFIEKGILEEYLEKVDEVLKKLDPRGKFRKETVAAAMLGDREALKVVVEGAEKAVKAESEELKQDYMGFEDNANLLVWLGYPVDAVIDALRRNSVAEKEEGGMKHFLCANIRYFDVMHFDVIAYDETTKTFRKVTSTSLPYDSRLLERVKELFNQIDVNTLSKYFGICDLIGSDFFIYKALLDSTIVKDGVFLYREDSGTMLFIERGNGAYVIAEKNGNAGLAFMGRYSGIGIHSIDSMIRKFPLEEEIMRMSKEELAELGDTIFSDPDIAVLVPETVATKIMEQYSEMALS